MKYTFTILSAFLVFSFISSVPEQALSQISFAHYVSHTMGSNPQKVAVADLNNDGLNDVVVGTGYYFDAVNDYSIFIYHQNSSGSLDNPVQYRYPTSYPGLRGMATGDVNNDGLTDIAVGYGDSIGIFYQQPNGTFGGYKSFYSGNTVDGISIGDLNNDGKNDIVVSHWNAAYIRVFIQGAAGALTSTTYASTQEGYDQISIGDINGDGLNDAVLMSGQGFGGIHVFTQNVSGALEAQLTYPYALNLHGMGIGDLNNDGHMDIACSAYTTNANSQLDIWYQDTTTRLLSATPLTITGYQLPEAVAIAKLGCDDKNQIIAADGGWGNVSVFSQDSVGNYSNYQNFGISGASHFEPGSMAVGDINNDGKNDIVVASFYAGGPDNGLLVLINNTTAGGVASVKISTPITSICSGTQIDFTAVPTTGGASPAYQWKINGVNQGTNDSLFSTSTLNNGDTVTCIMTSNAGCVTGSPATSNAVIINVLPKGNPGTITAARDTICIGTTGHLISTGNTGAVFQWQLATTPGGFSDIPGATSTTYTTPPLTETTYYQLVAGSGNCANTSPDYKLTVVESPSTRIIVSETDLQIAFSAIDSLHNIVSYTWDFGDSTTSTDKAPTHTYAAKGTYYVCLTVYNGSNCSYSFCANVSVGLTGIENLSAPGLSWSVYPNPFSNYIIVKSPNGKQPVESIAVYDVLGRKVIDNSFNQALNGTIKLDVSSLNAGMYFFEIKSNNSAYSLPIVKAVMK